MRTVKDEFDFNKVVPISEMSGGDAEDSILLESMAAEAETYLTSHKWCIEVLDRFFGLGVGGIVAVFLFHIKPSREEVDDYVWIIVGDLPPLYLTFDDAPNPARALNVYVSVMMEWAEAAIAGEDVSELPPVNAKPSRINGQALRRRLEFLQTDILRFYKDDLK